MFYKWLSCLFVGIFLAMNMASVYADLGYLIKKDLENELQIEWKWPKELQNSELGNPSTLDNWEVSFIIGAPNNGQRRVVLTVQHVVSVGGHANEISEGNTFTVRKKFDLNAFNTVISEEGNKTHENVHSDFYSFSFSRKMPPTDTSIVLTGAHLSVPNLVILDSFTLATDENVHLTWVTGVEKNTEGFRLWRVKEGGNKEYINVTMLEGFAFYQADCLDGKLIATDINKPSQLISAIGNSREGACYSFEDISINENGTYYYVLEDIDTSGKRTFHCKDMNAVTIGQGPAIDLKSAKHFCRQATGGVE